MWFYNKYRENSRRCCSGNVYKQADTGDGLSLYDVPARHKRRHRMRKLEKVELSHFFHSLKGGICRPSVCRKNGVNKGTQPIMFNQAMTTQGELPRRGKRRLPGGVCVRTDETPEVFVLGFFNYTLNFGFRLLRRAKKLYNQT